MADPLPSSRQSNDLLLCWLIGLAVGLAVLHGVLVLLWGPGPVMTVLPWYVPATHSFVALAVLSIAFLAFGRYEVLREPALFWVGMAFAAFGVFASFYVLSWPGLLPGERSLMAQPYNTASWFWHLQFSALAVLLLAALFSRRPRAEAAAGRRWLRLIVAGLAIIISIGWLSMALEQFLPLLVVDRAWTPLNTGWIYVLLVAFAVGSVLWSWRYRQTGDLLFGYVASAELILTFAMLTGIIGGSLYSAWWYWQRILWIAAFSVMLFGLLSEYVGLYRRERDKTRELEALQRAAQEERNRLRVLIETAPAGIVFHTAPDGRPLLSNSAAEIVLGRPLAPEVGLAGQPAHYGIYRPTGEPFPPEELPASRSLRGETCLGVEILVRQPSGREAYILANSAPLRDARGRIVGAVVAFQDITPIKQQERMRDDFLSAAAHELKTPVTTIKGYAQLMHKWAPHGHEPREGEAVEIINAQCDRISRRVQEMLEAVRFRTVPPELRRVCFDLGDLASEVAPRMQALTQVHRLVLKREAPASVEADRERIEEVLVSLLDNAIKYSPQGGEIEVRVWAQEGEGVVSVTDHGVGISNERQPHIFEPFYEVVPAGAPGYRGVVALSLYLSKLAVERHKGRIWFESEAGKGSTFYFSLPLAGKSGNDGRA